MSERRFRRGILAFTALFSAFSAARLALPQQTNSPPHEVIAAQDSTRPLLVFVPDSVRGSKGAVRAFYPDGRVDRSFFKSLAFPSWSPDGKRVAFLQSDSTGLRTLFVRTIGGKEDTLYLNRLAVLPIVMWTTWSPQSNELGILSGANGQFSASAEFVVIDVTNMSVRRRYPIPGSVLTPFGDIGSGDKVRWSPDGSALLISDQKSLFLDLADGRTEVIDTALIVAEWMPDGKGIYYLNINDQSAPRSRPGAELYRRLRGSMFPSLITDSTSISRAGIRLLPSLTPGSFELSPSGRRLALTAGVDSMDFAIHVYDFVAGEPLDITKPAVTLRPANFPLRMEWSPDEKQIAILAFATGRGLTVERADLRSRSIVNVVAIPMESAALEFLFIAKLFSWSR